MITSHKYQNSKIYGMTILLLIIIGSLLLSGCGAKAAPKVYRVGVLSGLDFFADTADGFKAKMTELGYVEGQNIVYDIQKTNFDIPTYQRILQKFVTDKVDLIFVFPTEASLEAKAAVEGTNIPVLFANANIEGVDLVDSVREPGGNITGVRYPGPDIAVKRFEFLHKLVPQAKRIWLPYQRGYPIVTSQLEILRPVAAAAGVTLIESPADNVAELEADLQARSQAADLGLDAILLIADPLVASPDTIALLGKFGAEHKVPIGGTATRGLFGLSTNSVAVGNQAAPLADKIFKGTPAGTIPVNSAESFLQINYALAQQQGITVPEGMLAQADEIIR